MEKRIEPANVIYADVRDNGNHEPGPEPHWQESAMFSWFDAPTSSGGWYRIGMHPNHGNADLYTWTEVNGVFADRRKSVDQPPLGTDVLQATCDGVTFQTIEPLAHYRINVEQPDLSLEFEFRPIMRPRSLNLQTKGSEIASNHYNAIGRAIGGGIANGKEFSFNTFGFLDHSWGPRRGIPFATRLIWAIFHEELYVVCFSNMTEDGPVIKASYIVENGELTLLTSESRLGLRIADNGFSPDGCDAVLIDAKGRRFEISGKIKGVTSLMPFNYGTFLSHGVAEYRMGQWLGTGLLEASFNPTGVPSWEAEILGLKNPAWIERS